MSDTFKAGGTTKSRHEVAATLPDSTPDRIHDLASHLALEAQKFGKAHA